MPLLSAQVNNITEKRDQTTQKIKHIIRTKPFFIMFDLWFANFFLFFWRKLVDNNNKKLNYWGFCSFYYTTQPKGRIIFNGFDRQMSVKYNFSYFLAPFLSLQKLFICVCRHILHASLFWYIMNKKRI